MALRQKGQLFLEKKKWKRNRKDLLGLAAEGAVGLGKDHHLVSSDLVLPECKRRKREVEGEEEGEAGTGGKRGGGGGGERDGEGVSIQIHEDNSGYWGG
jgi:hypothetical protein